MFRKKNVPSELTEIDILNASDGDLQKISQKLCLSLNLEEMHKIREYFAKKQRNPTDVELQTIAQIWSEHCFHKTFKGEVEVDGRIVRSLFKTYIFKVTEELKPSWCICVFKDNAGIIEFDENHAIAIKVETHNHPSMVDPFGGAATGVGGVIRDILGVWADPIACTDVLCFGPLDYDEELPKGIKHPKYLLKGVVAGIAHYGNNMGIPTVNGAIYFDEGYLGNIAVYCGCVGIIPKHAYKQDGKAGDLLVVIGNKTGRDGLHGVTFASAELSDETLELRQAVQIPDPIEEEKLKRAIIRVRDEKLANAITDLGGGGISCATCELAHRFNLGAKVELSKVHLRQKLKPWEIWLSESQERMFLVVPKKNIKRVLEILEEEEVEVSVIGEFINDKKIEVYYKGYKVAELDLDFLFNPPLPRRKARKVEVKLEEPNFKEPSNYKEIILKLLSMPNIASKEVAIRSYDHEVKGNTCIKPLYEAPNDATVIKPVDSSWQGIAISSGIKARYAKISSYWMAASAIDEAIRNNIAVGGQRIALLDNFTWGNPEKSDRLYMLVEACKACYDFAKAFGTPFISGKDSLYNESPLGPVLPTLLITAIGIVRDVRKCITAWFKKQGNPIYIVGKTRRELGASEYYNMLGFIGKSVPKVYADEAKKNFALVQKAIEQELLKACHDVSEGGLAIAIAEMCLAGSGALIDINKVPYEGERRNDFALFSESNSRFVVEVKGNREEDFLELARNVGACVAKIGEVQGSKCLEIKFKGGRVAIDVGEMRKAWRLLEHD